MANQKVVKAGKTLYLAIIAVLAISAAVLLYLYVITNAAYMQNGTEYSILNSNYISLKTQSQAQQTNLSTLRSQLAAANSTISTLQQNYNTIVNKTKTPFVEVLAINKTVMVPKFSFEIPFYSSTLNLYNNYTVDGNYSMNFTAPYDGYLLLYLYSSTGQNGTYGFQVSSNTSRTFYFNSSSTWLTLSMCPPYCASSVPAVAGYIEAPNTTKALYVLPVLRGKASFEIQNSNAYLIFVKFSLLYVGERFANTTIDTNYTGGSELPYT